MRSLDPDVRNALKLGEPYFQRITSTLVLLDQRLDEMERWASWPLPSGPLYLWRNDLDRQVLARIGLEAGKAKEELRTVTARLGLQSHERVASLAIRAEAIFSLFDLEDLEPRHIKAYEALTEAQAQQISTLWEPLRRPLEAIRVLCGAAPGGESGKDGVGGS